MPKQITELSVNFISIVDAGANRKPIVYKSDNNGCQIDFQIRIAKTDAEKGIIYGVVYEPDVVDTQGDWANADTIERAAHDFLKKGRVQMIDTQHNYEPVAGAVVESFIMKGQNANYPEAKDGAWCVAIEPSEEAKQRVKSGELKGLSLAGVCNYAEKSAGEQSSGEQSAADGARIIASDSSARIVRQNIARIISH